MNDRTQHPATAPALKLAAAEVERLIRAGLPLAERAGFAIERLEPGRAVVRLQYQPWMLRPGGTLAGPVLMTAADSAMYALVLAHLGPELLAVTADMNLHFLRKPKPADVLAEAHLLKLGRKLAVMRVELRSAGEDTLVAHVTGSYALPGRT
ncbi:MAG: PaaI family thioesterase [Nevskia sp.]|nr:PaaI family thioesterase [Nevskia sp.]